MLSDTPTRRLAEVSSADRNRPPHLAQQPQCGIQVGGGPRGLAS